MNPFCKSWLWRSTRVLALARNGPDMLVEPRDRLARFLFAPRRGCENQMAVRVSGWTGEEFGDEAFGDAVSKSTRS